MINESKFHWIQLFPSDLMNYVSLQYGRIIDIQEYRYLMSSSQYRRVSAQFENCNLAVVLVTDIQICGKYLCTLYKGMGVCLQILHTD